MINSRDSLRAGAQWVEGRMNEILKPHGMRVKTEPIRPEHDESSRLPTYKIALVYDVPPWMLNPYYNTRWWRLRWRLRWFEKMFTRLRRRLFRRS